ncbi:MAG: hypothetical protein ACRDMA_06905 [Solirubrobacterales bacterium]
MGSNRNWLGPATGLAFFVLAIVAFAISGEPPDPTDDSAEEIVEFYVDNESSQVVSAGLVAIGATLFVFFGGYLRRLLRDAEGEGGFLSAVAFAGTIVFAVGVAIDSTLTFSLAMTADDIEPGAVQALSALWNNDFVPFAVGIQIFMLALGISVVRHGALPRWIGWVAIVLALIAITPIGFVAFLATGLLVAIISVILMIRARTA